MANVLITGANGFIGSHIIDRMIEEGHQVTGFVRKSSDLSLIRNQACQLVYGDVEDVLSLDAAMKEIDIVIHNAGFASDWGSLDTFININVIGTQNVLRASAKAGVRRFVLMSSTAIHGFGFNGIMTEDSPINTHGFHYSISKWEAEKWVFEFARNQAIEVTAIRPGNVFGPRDHTFIEKYIDIMVKGQGGYVSGGLSKTCPVFVKNLTKAIALASVHQKAPGESFIITDGYDITWRQFTEKLADGMNMKRPSISIPFPIGNAIALAMEFIFKMLRIKNAPLLTSYRMHNGGKDYFFSINKAKNILGYTVETELDDAISQTVAWYKEKHNK